MDYDLVSVDSVANKATGTYAQAQAVIGKAEEYIDAAFYGARTWWGGALPGDSARVAAKQEIDKLQQRLGVQAYPEQPCADWEQARQLLFRARAEYAAMEEGNARTVDNMLKFPRDLAVSAGETIADIAEGVGTVAGEVAGGLFSGLGVTGFVILGAAGLVGYMLLRKGA